MSTGMIQGERNFLSRWVLRTTLGWLLGFILVVILAMLWDMFGGSAQFMIGIGMGAGVGFMQARLLNEWIDSTRHWLWASVIGMGIPFILWDVGTLTGVQAFFSLPVCVLIGSLFVGSLQQRMLRPQFEYASWWILMCLIGWGLPVGAIALGDADLLPGPWCVISIAAMFLGGTVLGIVTGGTLLWMYQRSKV